jgi:hypothetical protein
MENAGILYDHLEYSKDIWDILCPFGTFFVRLVYFSGFGIMYQEKSGNPGTVIWYILWPFGNDGVIWYIFPRFGLLCQEKSGNPGPELDLAAVLLDGLKK